MRDTQTTWANLKPILWNLECLQFLVNEFCPVPSWLRGTAFFTLWKGKLNRATNRRLLMSSRVPDGVKQGIEKEMCCGRNIVQLRYYNSSHGQMWKYSPVTSLVSSNVFMWWVSSGQQPSNHTIVLLVPTS